MVFVHNNLGLLARKDQEYKKGAEKLWDVSPESADFNMMIIDLVRSTLLDVDDEEDTTPSIASGTDFGSNDDEDLLVAATKDPNDPHFSNNPFDD